MIYILIALFIVVMVWQLISLARIIKHSIKSKIARLILYLVMVVLVLLYINDILVMMLWYWGAPAF